MQEEWKEIAGFNGVYYISSLGRVKRIYGGEDCFIAVSPNKNRNNYGYVNLQIPGKRKNSLVHRLVASHFLYNPENKPAVNHKDFNVANNSVENLEWVTHKENSAHNIKHGRQAHNRGEKCGRNVLVEKTVREILKDLRDKKMTHIQIAKKHNTNYSNVAHIFRGSRWAHVKI